MKNYYQVHKFMSIYSHLKLFPNLKSLLYIVKIQFIQEITQIYSIFLNNFINMFQY